MKRFLILEEFEQLHYEDVDEVFEQLQPYVHQPELELYAGSGLYGVTDGGEKTAFYVLQVTIPDQEDEPDKFRECEMPEFLKDALLNW